MKAVESRAEIYLMALQSLSKAEREAVIARLLQPRSKRRYPRFDNNLPAPRRTITTF